jgi:hypothetical protein
MAPANSVKRSWSCVSLLGLLDEACDVLTELDIALADGGGLAPVRHAH